MTGVDVAAMRSTSWPMEYIYAKTKQGTKKNGWAKTEALLSKDKIAGQDVEAEKRPDWESHMWLRP